MSAWCGDTITHGDSCIGTYLPVLLFLVALHHLLSAGRIFYKFLELQSTLLAVSAGWAVLAAKSHKGRRKSLSNLDNFHKIKKILFYKKNIFFKNTKTSFCCFQKKNAFDFGCSIIS